MRRKVLVVALLSSVSAMIPLDCASAAQPAQAAAAIAYPQTRRMDLVETQFGVPVADPYRWLENDVRTDAEVKAWVDAQNAVTNAYLSTLPGRKALEQRITELYDYERFAAPEKKGGQDVARGESKPDPKDLVGKKDPKPEDFTPEKVKKLLEQRAEMGNGKRPVDYGMAEALAFASLVKSGTHVRLSGQDTRRGTFNQRHSVLIDVENEDEYVPLEKRA